MQKYSFMPPLLFVLTGIAVAWLLHTFVITGYEVKGTCNDLPLMEGDRLIIYNTTLFNSKEYKGNLLCFASPTSDQNDMIGICQAEAGDTVKLKENHCIIVPSAGKAIKINEWNRTYLSNLLHLYENHNVCTCAYDNMLVVDGEIMSEVKFEEDYVWIGPQDELLSKENDSFCYGPIPLSRIKGIALLISYSKEPSKKIWQGFRPERFLKVIKPQFK